MIARPCLGCHRLIPTGSRCADCSTNLYRGDYTGRARIVRQTAERCWLCGEGPRADDPWTADHVNPGDPTSELKAAHRSCNSRRGDASSHP